MNNLRKVILNEIHKFQIIHKNIYIFVYQIYIGS